MNALKDIGELGIIDSRDGGKDYLLKPSFDAMTKIGEPDEIIATFAKVHDCEAGNRLTECVNFFGGIPDWVAHPIRRESDRLLADAMDVLQACCEEDLTPVIGGWTSVGHSVMYVPGAMPQQEIIIFAQELLQHGVVGKAKIRRLQRHDSSEAAPKFMAIEYINAARIHFGMSLEEAKSLTMTEFQILLAAKYPEEKGLTREEYSDVADDFLAKQAARRSKQK